MPRAFGSLMARAFERILGASHQGSVAFVRCLPADVVKALARDARAFAPAGWRVLRVAEVADPGSRTVLADQAVEARESKGDALLLLVDVGRAGAGMDGIYSAAREVGERQLFDEAQRLALGELATTLGAPTRQYAERAIRAARRGSLPPSRIAEFSFLCRQRDEGFPGAQLGPLGLWPVRDSRKSDPAESLAMSRRLVSRLLGIAGARLPPAQRVESIQIDPALVSERRDLEQFLDEVDTLPARRALAMLEDRRGLWVGALRLQPTTEIRGVKLKPWRNRNGTLARWSGLRRGSGGDPEPPELILQKRAPRGTRDAFLAVRWSVEPAALPRGAADYRVLIRTIHADRKVISEKELPHRALKSGEKVRFTADDFEELSEDAVVQVAAFVEVVGHPEITPPESEDFVIRFGEEREAQGAGPGKEVRTFSEGLIELEGRSRASAVVADPRSLRWDPKSGWVILRTPFRAGQRHTFKVRRPTLVADAEDDWARRQGEIGRWRVEVRADGSPAAEGPDFIPCQPEDGENWQRARNASQSLARRFARGGGVAQTYDDAEGVIPTVRNYLRAWSDLLGSSSPLLALANTLEVRSQSRKPVGLIVLPMHPVRVAWHAAYDSLVLHAAFAEEQKPAEIRREFAVLDGSMFPAFLPNPEGGAFVFADMLGFHFPAMVADSDPEPRAAVAILARLFGGDRAAGIAPTVGGRTAAVLGAEVSKYLDAHTRPRVLHLHALRAGDGMTVARALGAVHAREKGARQKAGAAAGPEGLFSLDLYPSAQQRSVAGRFIAEAREKRRTVAGVLAREDRWMLESLSLPGGVTRPRLRWARKEMEEPKASAHLALAFDTFASRVERLQEGPARGNRPFHAFGLSSFYERRYSGAPSPTWASRPAVGTKGEKHPARPVHTANLVRVQSAVDQAVARRLGPSAGVAVLRTTIGDEKAASLRGLHRCADWVVTVDRNAGIEYFDSPRDDREIYDAYVIDCVPEREDLGCLQLITSTANVDEVRSILEPVLNQMRVSRRPEAADFVLEQLKALSGRLAIRLTGRHPPAAELVALALCHANCRASMGNDGWVSLRDGFFVPVDDVRDLLAPFSLGSEAGDGARPDLIYVSLERQLCFRFIEVKYRRHLRAAQTRDTLARIERQTQKFRARWQEAYGNEAPGVFRAVRRANLARVLRFYADKAARHHLAAERHAQFATAIDTMVERGARYAFATPADGDRGWVFCPEYAGRQPLRIGPGLRGVQVFLCGAAAAPGFGALATNTATGGPDVMASAKRLRRSNGEGRDLDEEPHADSESGAAALGGDSSGSAAARSTPKSDSPAAPIVRVGKGRLTEEPVKWELSVKGNPHLLIAGLPGMGKTTCLVNLCRQMVAHGVSPIVFSYHQDIDEKLEEVVGSVRFVDFAGLGFNPLDVVSSGVVNAHLDVAGSIRDIFSAIYPEIGDVQTGRIRTAVKESFEEVGWGPGKVGNQTPPFGRFMEILRSVPDQDIGLRRLLERLGELEDYGLFAPARVESQSLWSGTRTTVVRVHSTQNDVLQRAFSFLVFYGMYKDMFRRGIQDQITHALVFDEAHRAAKLSLLPTMAKECRKYGVSFVLASQESRDFDPSVYSAIANYLILRCTDVDARALVRNVATRRQERSLVDRIKQMPKYHALHFGEGRSRPSQLLLDPPAELAGAPDSGPARGREPADTKGRRRPESR